MESTYIKEYIKEKRPALSASSLATYASIIKKLYLNCVGEGQVDFSKFEDFASLFCSLIFLVHLFVLFTYLFWLVNLENRIVALLHS